MKLLWLEDEHDADAFKGTVAKAQSLGFKITFCKYSDEFIDSIDSKDWDAIILDVVGKTNNQGTLGNDGFNMALDKILADYKSSPWFVFSGQTEITAKESTIRERLEAKYLRRDYADIIYVKGDDNDKLFKDVTNAVQNIDEWKIRNKYRDILSTNVDKTLILKLLIAFESGENKETSLYNDTRKILEDTMQDCLDKSFITTHETALNARVRSFSGKSEVPKYIKKYIDAVNFAAQEGSHSNLPTHQDTVNSKAPYLIQSTIISLLNIIIWWDQYKRENSL